MQTAQSALLHLKPLASLSGSLDSNFEGRYNNILRGLAQLTSEITQLTSGLHAYVVEDLEFIMHERAALMSQRATDKTPVIRAVEILPDATSEPRVQVTDIEVERCKEASHTAAEAAAVSKPQKVVQKPQPQGHFQNKHFKLPDSTVTEAMRAKYVCQSDGHLPMYLHKPEVSRDSRVRSGSVPDRPGDPRFKEKTNDARAAALTRAWLVAKGEEASWGEEAYRCMNRLALRSTVENGNEGRAVSESRAVSECESRGVSESSSCFRPDTGTTGENNTFLRHVTESSLY